MFIRTLTWRLCSLHQHILQPFQKSSSSTTQISTKAAYSTSSREVIKYSNIKSQLPVKSISDSSQSSSTQSTISSASSSTTRTNLDISKLNGKVLTAETLAQIVLNMTTKVSNMTLYPIKLSKKNSVFSSYLNTKTLVGRTRASYGVFLTSLVVNSPSVVQQTSL